MIEKWFTVEYDSGHEWHLYAGPFNTLREARTVQTKEHKLRIVEHRIRVTE